MNLQLENIQKLIIYPQMQLSLSILKMDDVDLLSYLQDYAQQNPVVDIALPQCPEKAVPFSPPDFESFQTYDSLDERSYYSNESDEYTGAELAEQPYESVHTFLEHQIGECKMSPHIKKYVMLLFEYINGNGYLEADLDELAGRGYSMPVLNEALALIQSLEPAGVGARNLPECLCLQLARKNMLTPLREVLIHRFLYEICKGKEQETAEKLGISRRQLRSEYEVIRTLNPKPCSSMNTETGIKYIIPDITVRNNNGELQIEYNTYTPRLIVNKTYVKMLETAQNAEVQEYINKQLKSAKLMMDCLRKRRKTICAVSEAIVDIQKNFFLYGETRLCPMNLQDVADKAQIHESTVCRAINGKYILCDYGLYEIKKLFRIAKGKETGNCMGNIKSCIQDIIKNEDGRKPLSDQEIAEILLKNDMKISRRTVNKYREQLNILPSRLRYR
jgi:RNA polymerase sigma-54 factor